MGEAADRGFKLNTDGCSRGNPRRAGVGKPCVMMREGSCLLSPLSSAVVLASKLWHGRPSSSGLTCVFLVDM
mgnify:CR=1 FL=1